MATGYIVRRSGYAVGKDGTPVHLSPDTQHLVGSLLSDEAIAERVANGALEAYQIPDEPPAEETATEGSSRRRRSTGE